MMFDEEYMFFFKENNLKTSLRKIATCGFVLSKPKIGEIAQNKNLSRFYAFS